VLEEGDGFTLVEVRAALERITYERLKGSLASGMLERQQLLLSEIIEVSASQCAWIMAHQAFLEKAGLEVEAFGQGATGHASKSIKIDTIPVLLKEVPVTQLVHELMSDIQSEEAKTKDPVLQGIRMSEEALARSISRMTAKAQKIAYDETTAMMLLGDLIKCEFPYATPSGRPTMLQFSEAEIERKFRC
jgi:DNA mismatch repair protein MutL